ncbi:MAG: LPXTG cell wall anchor domain-containing protein, partial [Ilumatobacteraceae bacterium]|nr:LPXTG cell wall anchor domain-containing protein [Ilumatobacteraceae bacterium]
PPPTPPVIDVNGPASVGAGGETALPVAAAASASPQPGQVLPSTGDASMMLALLAGALFGSGLLLLGMSRRATPRL